MGQEIRKMKPRKAVESSDRRLALVAAVLAVCVALTLGIVFLVSGNRRENGEGIVAQQGSAPTGTTPAAPKLTIEQVEVPPLSIYHRRNPFRPLVDLEASVPVPAGTSTPTGGAANVITVPPELNTGTSASDNVVSRALTLERIFQQDDRLFARIRVADQLFEKVAVGESFGENYKLLALDKDSSAIILYGDERFTVYSGQSIYW